MKERVSRTLADEQALARRFRAGDLAARDELVDGVRPLLGRFLQRLQYGPEVDHEDLLQEGVLALYRAATTYDPERGFRFSTYAGTAGRRAMERALLVARSRVESLDALPEGYEDARTDRAVLLPPWACQGPPPVEERVVRQLYLQQLRASIAWLLAELPAEQRQLVLARFGLDGKEPRSVREWAKAEGRISFQAMAMLQKRVFRHLRARMEQPGSPLRGGGPYP